MKQNNEDNEDDENKSLIPSKSDINNDNENDKPEWSLSHIFNILFGAGVGSLLEFYSFCLVAYFEDELEAAYFPPSSVVSDELLEEFTLYGIGTNLYNI